VPTLDGNFGGQEERRKGTPSEDGATIGEDLKALPAQLRQRNWPN